MQMNLNSKVALITGGSMGLGRAIAEAYLAAGASVFLVARDAYALLEAALALPEGDVHCRDGDVSDPLDTKKIVASALVSFSHIDILVNNAAIHGPIGCLTDTDPDGWEYAVKVNLIGPALLMRAVLPHMRIRGSGKIINISGGGATSARPYFSAYAAAKTGLVRLTETVAAEYAGTGIDINTMSPGKMPTRLLAETGETGGDFAPAVKLALWLASSDSDGVTGRLLSAQWDNYEGIKDNAALSNDDFTLRRQVPDWGKR